MDRTPKSMLGRANTYPEARLPWEIYVNAHGQRFVREDESSIDVREHALLDQPELRYWIVFDDSIFRQAPPIVYDWSREQMAEAFNTCEVFHRADSLESLAKDIGVPGGALAETVAKFTSPDSHRAGSAGPGPIARILCDTPPFYAYPPQEGPYPPLSRCGQRELQVVRRTAPQFPACTPRVNPGSGQLQGNAFVGGMIGHACYRFRRCWASGWLSFDASQNGHRGPHRRRRWPGAGNGKRGNG